jgi:hypothetical protein
MSELPRDRKKTRGMPARRWGRSPRPPSTVRPEASAADQAGSETHAVHPIHEAARKAIDPALRARLRYLAWRRYEVRATDVDDIVRAALEAYRQTVPSRGSEPERYDILAVLFRQERDRFLARLARRGRVVSDCHRDPRPRGRGTDAFRRCDEVAHGDPTSGHSGAQTFVRRRRRLGQSLRAILMGNRRVRTPPPESRSGVVPDSPPTGSTGSWRDPRPRARHIAPEAGQGAGSARFQAGAKPRAARSHEGRSS